jgi:hypothetical protein
MVLAAMDLAARVKNGEPLTANDPAPGELPVVGGIVGRTLRHQGGQQNRDLRALRDRVHEAFMAEEAADPEWPLMDKDEQNGVRSYWGKKANDIVYGTQRAPGAIVEDLRDAPWYRSMPREQQIQELAALRQELDRRAAEAKTDRERGRALLPAGMR